MAGLTAMGLVGYAAAQNADGPAALRPGDAAPASGDAAARSAEAVIRPGDKVRVGVWLKPEYTGEFLVDADGHLEHPIYRNATIVGVPLPVARGNLESALSSMLKDPATLTAEPLFRVMVGGEVRNPSLTWLPRGTTVGQAIALAGGPTERGRLNHVRLVRDQRIQTLDLTDPTRPGDGIEVHSGDQILVSRAGTSFLSVFGFLASLTAAAASVAVLAKQ